VDHTDKLFQSTTWKPANLYSLSLDSDLNYTGNGEYGFDTVALQLPQSGGTTLAHQVVAGNNIFSLEKKHFKLTVNRGSIQRLFPRHVSSRT
jgi:hypothetical protein